MKMGIVMETIEELLDRFKKNVGKGVQSTLMFDGDDTMTLSCDPSSAGHVGFGIVQKEKSPDRQGDLDG